MSNLSVNTITNAAGGNTAQINGMTPTADSLQGFRNRLINSDMRIAQRGTSFAGLTNGSSDTYTLDRWVWAESGTSTAVQTVSQDSSAPAGFVNSLKVLTTTAQALLAAGNGYKVGQLIEGFNTADLGWGTANAQTVTLSFWVRSSLTGTFGGFLRNSALNRYYVYSYSINSADTWEYKTVTITGDTTGTWLTNNGAGIDVRFSFGTGSDYLTTPGSWGATRFEAPTGQVNVAGTLNATFYITGVQLEAGSVATPFERRPYSTELQLAQRYYQKFAAGVGNFYPFGSGTWYSTTYAEMNIPLKVTMRASPSGSASAASTFLLNGGVSITATAVNPVNRITPDIAGVSFEAASGGVTGYGMVAMANNSTATFIDFSAEL
jgi:hypothetical protein